VNSEDFIEVLDTWLNIYRDNYNANAKKNKVNTAEEEPIEFAKRQDQGMLRVISTMHVIDSFKNTAAEQPLRTAIEQAKSGDCAKLPEIYDNLEKVETFLGQ